MSGFIGSPSNTNYFEVHILFLRYLHTALELEVNAPSKPTHDTMQWYQVLCFGGAGDRGDSDSSSPLQSLATGLSALLNQMRTEQDVRLYVYNIIQ